MDCSTRLPCPSLFPRVCSDSCPLSRWCYLTISSSAAPFSLCLQSFPALVFSNELALCIRWPKYWSFNFSISPWNEYSGLISFRTDWFDLLAVQETLNSLLQHHSLKASIFQCLAFFMVQLSHPYVTTEKTTALTLWTFVGKVMSLLVNTLSRFVIAFLPWSKHHHDLSFLNVEFITMILVFWILSQPFHSPLSPSSRGTLVPLCFLLLGWYHLHFWAAWYFSQ